MFHKKYSQYIAISIFALCLFNLTFTNSDEFSKLYLQPFSNPQNEKTPKKEKFNQKKPQINFSVKPLGNRTLRENTIQFLKIRLDLTL